MKNEHYKLSIGAPAVGALLGVLLSLLAATGHADAQNLLARKVTRYEEARLQKLPDKTLGPGRALAVVRVAVDRSHVEEVSTTYGQTAVTLDSRSEASGTGRHGSTEVVQRKVSRRIVRRSTTGPRYSAAHHVYLLSRGRRAPVLERTPLFPSPEPRVPSP